ncbi:MAG TPA: ATP-binding protein [Terriglobales bacterium]|nr:ATP-binding protein [Terriglobales bacterium]
MPVVDADILFRLANAVLATASLAIAGLIVMSITRRRSRNLEPLGLAFLGVFLAVGLRSAVRAISGGPPDGTDYFGLYLAVDWLGALAAVTFLALRRRYGIFIESATIVSEYEHEFAEKEREARSLAQINEELRRLDELKSEFLAMVSHELRTPLTAIVGYSRLLIRQVHGPLNAKQTEHQEAIFRSAQRLTDLINELLDVSRLESGRVELAPRPTDARMMVDQAIAVVAVAAQAKRITITNALTAETPPVQADPERLQQILVNLLSNAVKFTPDGGEVTVSAGPHKDQMWLAVQDTGVGIPRDELARIWDPFYQVESTLRRRHGGSGLGLTIVRRLVELHGGLVRAESEGENRGSRFTFTLPVASEPATAAQAAPREVAIDRVLAGRRVLVVEDERDNQNLMRAVVEDLLGGEVSVSADGERAVFEAVESPPALILLDLMLPSLSGWEVARRLRQNQRTKAVPIIAVTALARPQERESALHAGCDAYLSKPFSPDDLARLIAATLARQGVGAR